MLCKDYADIQAIALWLLPHRPPARLRHGSKPVNIQVTVENAARPHPDYLALKVVPSLPS